MMNAEWKARWIKALRSGKYQQARNQLCVVEPSPAFCCLGVLCDISQLGRWTASGYRQLGGYEAAITLLPEFVMNLTGLDDQAGRFDLPEPERDTGIAFASLTHLNDSGFTFEQIADIIEYFF